MRKNFRKLVLLFTLFYFSFNSVQAQSNVIDQIVWVVGDEAILKSEIEGARREMLAAGQRFEGDPYCLIPEQIAVQKLFLHQAKIDSIDVPLSSVNREVEYNLNRMIQYYGSQEKLVEYLGQSINEIREDMQDRLRENAITDEVRKKLIGKIKLTPAEISRYYNKLPKDSLPYIPKTVEVQIITTKPPISLKETDAIKNRLRDYTDKVNKGESSFSTLALMYSEDDESAKRGGELGFTGRNSFVPEFANAAFSLTDPKKISNIVESEYGYHIIQLIERRGDRINVRHILLKPKVQTDDMNKTIARMDSLRNDIVSNKFSFEEAAMYLSSDKDTKNNNGLMANLRSNGMHQGTSRFEMQDLPAEVSNVVKGLSVGEISQPFIIKEYNGKEVVAMVKLKQRVEGHRANISDDFEIMKTIVENEKSEQILKKWLQKKIKDTYVWINEDWRNCDFQYEGWLK